MGPAGNATKQRAQTVPTAPKVLKVLTLPLAFTLLLLALSLLPAVRDHQPLRWSFWGAAAALLTWNAALLALATHHRRRLVIDVALRPQHYLQACAHLSILLYWGWYWREVYAAAPLIAGQLAFAYAFDALLSWSRRDSYVLGFGPFPIIFSTNLFLWFKPDWFYLQFLMVAVGFSAKELMRWTKDGRRTHIFNPSSFTLMLFSIGLLLTGKTGITWGPEIASTQLNPPYIYFWIFLVTLPAQFLFGVAPMTWAAVSTTYLVEVVYFASTGIHFFPERPIPIAVFLGMHLLFTDPSTSPRTELGRLVFGVSYGLSVCGLLALLTYFRLPTFYDKLLPVPLLNLLIQGIDRAARSNLFRRFDPGAIGRGLVARRRNLAYMTVWALTFITIQISTRTQAILVRADSLLSQGRVDDAIERYREFVRRDPADFEGHNNLGVALMQTGQVDEAVAAFEHAIVLRPDAPSTLDNLGLALTRAGQAGSAVPRLQRAVSLQPANPALRDHLGQALIEAGHLNEGLISLTQAVALDPASAEAHDNLGVALMQAGRFTDAAAALQRADTLQPNTAQTLNNLGIALMRAGRPADGLAPLQHAVELNPKSPESQDGLGQALMQTGRFEEAAASFQRAVDLQPGSPDSLNNLGVSLMQAGRFDEAASVLQRLVAMRPTQQGHANLGVALMRARRVNEALTSFRRAVDLAPANPDAHEALAQALLQSGDPTDPARTPDEALRHALRAAELSEHRDPHVLDVLGAAYASQGRWADARRSAEEATGLVDARADAELADEIRSHLNIYRARSAGR